MKCFGLEVPSAFLIFFCRSRCSCNSIRDALDSSADAADCSIRKLSVSLSTGLPIRLKDGNGQQK